MNEASNTHWIPLSDLMMGLMMVFLLLATLYMLRVEQTTTLIIKEYEITRKNLKMALQDEFSENFKEWNAELLGDMTIRFRNPDVLFSVGSDKLKPKFAAILDDFIPRYVEILTSGRFKESIKEIRVEGHTSTFWTTATTKLDAYFRNMELSQARTRSTLERILKSNAATAHEEWLKKRLTANGLSSSQPIVGKDGIIDEKASQRVEFRIVTNADENISKIANTLDKNEDI